MSTGRRSWPVGPTSRLRDAFWRRLDPRRRYNCQDQGAATWEERAEKAVALLASFVSSASWDGRLQVADLGAGNERLLPILERQLSAAFDYHPYDLHPQSRGVERIDLEWSVPSRTFDVVFCLGLLEYINDLDRFVSGIGSICRLAVVSYVVADIPGSIPASQRRERGWLSDLGRAELEELFLRHSYTHRGYSSANSGRTGLWLWAAPSENAADQRP